jgi:predicted unusual protein kinase regulating ubiquinone biosynthesis (AarF/ABC1/UbiB family)
VLKYLSRKPFLSKAQRKQAKASLDQENAAIVFKGLSLLRGTALKIAQMLSLELELFPATVRQELEKSYNQVPPINRALVRKIIQNAFNAPPETVFRSFDTDAFAAASLGQVHFAEAWTGETLAVKIQYPGIRRTIKNDIQMVKGLLLPLPEYALVRPALQEIEARLLEETNYQQEAAHLAFFGRELTFNGFEIPQVYPSATTATVLSMTCLEGLPLNQWLKNNPDRTARDRIAQSLHDMFLYSLYDLNCIHADPNPGNYLIQDDLTIGLVDFGCVKKLKPDFVRCYRQLPQTVIKNDRKHYFHLLRELNFIDGNLDRTVEDRMYQLAYRFGQWFGQLFTEEYFDFSANPDFFAKGRALSHEMYQLRNHVSINPNFVFLDRTRYGLLRLFEAMGARVRISNQYEWDA